ncbi:tRNA lysidine(34) synthetase TilS [Oceanospirillum sediminis]|uniref:tRNA(Ile)-lysidine synthase n=1 Tax=Oceanospirillum sediminis TaxID=2760088 RepID=A0A839IJC4_9GAMM|nr:tRNA lysidine(34) synthetase TilS [Oceanospirillum sediminis]MBB1485028.1 tRNA lysidine(34) synthetase TilS [Oceanospirillum sediminis]
MSETAENLLPALSLPEHNQLWLALSGGLDSVVLLDLAVNWCRVNDQVLRVIHIHHGLSPNADQWARFCQVLCLDYTRNNDVSVEFECHRVTLDLAGNIEEQARKARYAVFEQQLGKNDLLLMAHHSDDQAETFLLRLLRGSGSQGLRGMPVLRSLGQGKLFRPLLSVQRKQLEQWAEKYRLNWVDDESNQSLAFDRNYLRHKVIPAIQARWPESHQQFMKATANLADEAGLLRDLAELDLQSVRQSSAWSREVLCCDALRRLSEQRRINVLRHWLADQGMSALEKKQWQIVLDEILAARQDAEPCFRWQGKALRRFRNQLFCISEADSEYVVTAESEKDSRVHLAVYSEKGGAVELNLPGLLSVTLMPGRADNSDESVIALPDTGYLEVRPRQGGEVIRLKGRGKKQVKKLLQESQIPPWIRQKLPMLWWCSADGEEQLIAVADRWLSESHLAAQSGRCWQLTVSYLSV